jgi:hypothetical protein
MYFNNIDGKKIYINTNRYLIDWNSKERSIIQFKVKKFLEPFWRSHIVYSELRVVSTRMTIDIYNASKKIAIEVQGKQHQGYNKFFHANSKLKYLSQLERDEKKIKFCEQNGITLVEIFEEEIDQISKEWFLKKYNITL